MLKIEDIKSSIAAARKSAMQARLTLNGKTNWLQADSDAVLLDMAKAYHDALVTIDAEEMEGEGSAHASALREAADAEFMIGAHLLTNPSALRQTMITHKVITAPAETNKRSNKAASLIAGL